MPASATHGGILLQGDGFQPGRGSMGRSGDRRPALSCGSERGTKAEHGQVLECRLPQLNRVDSSDRRVITCMQVAPISGPLSLSSNACVGDSRRNTAAR
jgi:hypothetical protein